MPLAWTTPERSPLMSHPPIDVARPLSNPPIESPDRSTGPPPPTNRDTMARRRPISSQEARMPARTGQQYLNGLRAQDREVWLGGERVKDVTAHPGLGRGARAIAGLYDLQHDPALRETMTYVSPTSGDRVGLSFVVPRTRDDLE